MLHSQASTEILEYESSILLTDDKCSVTVYNPTFYEKDLEPIAFAMRSDWIHAKKFNSAMQRLKEAGELQTIYTK